MSSVFSRVLKSTIFVIFASLILLTSCPEPGMEKTENPTFSVPSGTELSAGDTVALNCSDNSAQLFYTIGNEAQKKYTEPITINDDCTISAYAVSQGKSPSDTVKASYTVKKVISDLVFNKTGEIPFLAKSLKVTSSTPDVTFFYTLDGSEPSLNEDEKTKKTTDYIDLSQVAKEETNVTVKVIAVKDGYEKSNILTGEYTKPKVKIQFNRISTGNISFENTELKIISTPDNANIFYSFNEEDAPTTESTKLVGDKFPISELDVDSLIVKVLATADGYQDSDILIGNFSRNRINIYFENNLEEIPFTSSVKIVSSSAKLFYSFDGQNFQETTSGEISLQDVEEDSITIYAYAERDGYDRSEVISKTYRKQPVELTISDPSTSIFPFTNYDIYLFSQTPGVSISYSVNGAEPIHYENGVLMEDIEEDTAEIKFIASAPGYKTFSETRGYEKESHTAAFNTPSDNPILFTEMAVSIDSHPWGAEFYYTLDGTEPSLNSEKSENGLLNLSTAPEGEVTVKVLSVLKGYKNARAEAVYKQEQIGSVKIDSPDELLINADTITLSSTDYNVIIEFRLVGNGISEYTEWTTYSDPIVLSSVFANGKIQARAKKTGYATSEITEKTISTYEPETLLSPIFAVTDGAVVNDSIPLYLLNRNSKSDIYYTVDGEIPTLDSYKYNPETGITGIQRYTTITAASFDKEGNSSEPVQLNLSAYQGYTYLYSKGEFKSVKDETQTVKFTSKKEVIFSDTSLETGLVYADGDDVITFYQSDAAASMPVVTANPDGTLTLDVGDNVILSYKDGVLSGDYYGLEYSCYITDNGFIFKKVNPTVRRVTTWYAPGYSITESGISGEGKISKYISLQAEEYDRSKRVIYFNNTIYYQPYGEPYFNVRVQPMVVGETLNIGIDNSSGMPDSFTIYYVINGNYEEKSRYIKNSLRYEFTSDTVFSAFGETSVFLDGDEYIIRSEEAQVEFKVYEKYMPPFIKYGTVLSNGTIPEITFRSIDDTKGGVKYVITDSSSIASCVSGTMVEDNTTIVLDKSKLPLTVYGQSMGFDLNKVTNKTSILSSYTYYPADDTIAPLAGTWKGTYLGEEISVEITEDGTLSIPSLDITETLLYNSELNIALSTTKSSNMQKRLASSGTFPRNDLGKNELTFTVNIDSTPVEEVLQFIPYSGNERWYKGTKNHLEGISYGGKELELYTELVYIPGYADTYIGCKPLWIDGNYIIGGGRCTYDLLDDDFSFGVNSESYVLTRDALSEDRNTLTVACLVLTRVTE